MNKGKAVERLREFIRFGYMTASEVARWIDVHESTVNSWVTGYECREYKNWRAGFPSRGSVRFASKLRVRSGRQAGPIKESAQIAEGPDRDEKVTMKR
jgi:hypothetical protein